ncbi:MAG: type II secretion system F family protein [Paraburkholderia sp.]|nr:MAG: type II secretion system F family protein [Paraburkholderia sp.]
MNPTRSTALARAALGARRDDQSLTEPHILETRFRWKGVLLDGARRGGLLIAPDRATAHALLQAEGIIAARLDALGPAAPARTSTREVTAFTRQLANLLCAGLALVQALELLARTSPRSGLPRVASGLARRITAGQRFAAALAAYPAQFDRLYCELAGIGEATGSLGSALARLAEQRERAAAQRAKLRAALAYPCGVMALAVIVTAALLAFVVPTFEQVFDNFGAALPGPTRAVMALSAFLTDWGPLSLAALAAIALVAARLMRGRASARMAFDRFLLAAPAVAPLARAIAAARWSRALGTLLTAGIPLADALGVLANVTGNAVFTAANAEIEARLRRGERLAHAMRAVGCFPAALVEPLAVAEESSALDAVLLDWSTLAEREVDERLAFASACAEPLLVMVLGLVIGSLIVALYLPVIELGNVV